jgi:hypothetical protein
MPIFDIVKPFQGLTVGMSDKDRPFRSNQINRLPEWYFQKLINLLPDSRRFQQIPKLLKLRYGYSRFSTSYP